MDNDATVWADCESSEIQDGSEDEIVSSSNDPFDYCAGIAWT